MLQQSFKPNSLEFTHRRIPWQLRLRPALSATVGSIVAIVVTVGVLLTARRLLGEMNGELFPGLMLALALASAVIVTYARLAWRRNFPIETPADLSGVDQVIGWGTSIGLACLAVGCCYPGYRTVDWLIWLPILVADQIWRQDFFDAGQPGAMTELVEDFSWPAAITADSAISNEVAEGEFAFDENILQQLFRVREDDGVETIYGTVGADFVAGQRVSVVHIGFCPPLAYLPELVVEALPGSSAKIKIVQALAHGVRLDVRLPQVAEDDCQIWIDMAARPKAAKASKN